MGAHDASLSREWGDGVHTFRLAIKQLLELQDLTNAGPVEICDRLGMRRWRLQDLREVIRLGLIGGGMAPQEAHARVVRYVDGRPLMESVALAIEILGAALVGPQEDPPPGKRAAEDEMGASPLPPSMPAVAPSGSPPLKSET